MSKPAKAAVARPILGLAPSGPLRVQNAPGDFVADGFDEVTRLAAKSAAGVF